jgi:3-deoxy-manno-octulosonate cytidylyltransferase (CMP-KDO synthetase)
MDVERTIASGARQAATICRPHPAAGAVDRAGGRPYDSGCCECWPGTAVKTIVCIPARYASTRFPGKVLARDTGKFLIQHTWEQARRAKLPQRVVIAADDAKIVEAARTFGAECVLTSTEHNSGTDRIAEAVGGTDAEIVINVQGDEPQIDPDHIDYLARLLQDSPEASMATLATGFASREQITDPNVVKVVVDAQARAIYFSRSVIPYDRERAGVGEVGHYLRHIGIYAYRRQFLLTITALPQTPLEKLEKLEQLRAIENGYTILVGKVEYTCEGIDTPEQYAAFVKRYLRHTEDDHYPGHGRVPHTR